MAFQKCMFWCSRYVDMVLVTLLLRIVQCRFTSVYTMVYMSYTPYAGFISPHHLICAQEC
jgi:hypothetical protein